MKQTAVEWLEQQLYKSSWDEMTHEERMNICCTAKLMEREQIIYSNYNGQGVEKKLKDINIHQMITKAEQYYNETFKSE